MIDALVTFAVHRRWFVLVITLLLAGYGLYNAFQMPIDAVPDISNIQVQVNTEANAYSPLEAEQRITYMVENAMAGLPKLNYTRSLSRYGLSQVTVVFEDGTDIYWARQQVAERLQGIRSQLPPGVEPALGPIASGLGEIFAYVVRPEEGARRDDGGEFTPEDLRTIQDWIIRPQLIKVPGVTEINSTGGYVREYQVAPDPGKLLAYKLTIDDLVQALDRNNRTVGAGYIERNGEQWLVRSEGLLASLDEISEVVVTRRDDAPVKLKDVAEVKLGKELRTGAATHGGVEVVMGTAFMLHGENSRTVAKAVADRLVEINRSLPDGIVAEALYDRTTLVDKTIATVQKNLLEGAVLVIAVLLALLGNVRAAIIAASVIPLSMLFAFTGMATNRTSGNLMSLGAIDFGLIVDGAVIVVENAIRRLGLAQQRLGRVLNIDERANEVIASTREVFQPAVFGMLIIMLVYLPIFALGGVEGKMFHPMAFTVVAALCGALLFSITFVPAAVVILVRGKVSDRENRLMEFARRMYRPVLEISIRYPFSVVAIAMLVVLMSLLQAGRLGAEFLPQLDEHDIALHALRIPGTGLQQSVEMQQQLESVLAGLGEVEHVFSKIGTPDVATDPMPPNVADTYLILKLKPDWPDPGKSKAELLDEIRATVEEIPGNKYELTQPIEMRFNELIAGVRTDVAIRIYGDDLDALAALGEQAGDLLARVDGGVDIQVEQMTGLPMISVEPQREHLALLGLSVADVQQELQAAIGGIATGYVYEGDRRFRLLIRMDEEHSRDPAALSKLLIALPGAADPDLSYVPLGEVAEVVEETGPNQINRESGKRNVVITTNVEGRDLASFIAETQSLMNDELVLPAGYWMEYGGTFEQLQSATERLMIVVPLTLVLILGLLLAAFGSLRDALIIYASVPLALTGGIIALTLRGMPLSISAAVGFIALSGVAVLNGVVMLSFIRNLRESGHELVSAIREGASQRLRPVLMTALVASLGFLPMALNSGTGAEVQRPLATVVVGGIISATLLTLIVLPALYQLSFRLRGQKLAAPLSGLPD